jgi:hypothetical protein
MLLVGNPLNSSPLIFPVIDRDAQIPRLAKLAALLSLILWVGIFSAGRGLGFVLAPGGLHYGVP